MSALAEHASDPGCQGRLLALLSAERRFNQLAYTFPDRGPYRRELYPKHMAFITAGATRRERAFIGGNSTGKTVLGSFEVACHATGRYPEWWTGHRFNSAIPIWVAGDTSETARDIVQAKLFGNVAKDPDLLGTGMIPRDAIDTESIRYRQNTNRAIDFARVRNEHGGWSIVSIKSYDQGRRAFQGTEIPLIWLDEEEKEGAGVYGECVVRGRGTAGKIILTFTPLRGWTLVVDSFMKWEAANAEGGSKIMITCGWDDVPHLTEEYKRTTLASTPGYLRDARKYGTPVAGKGKVYPVDEKDFVIPPIPLPGHFRRVCGFDGGWYNTAAVWLAYDKDSDTAYLYSDYKRGEVEVPVHAAAIKARGTWIPVLGDAAAINQGDGKKILDLYRKEGIHMRLAEKSVDAGIQEVLTRLSTGRLRVFSTCQKWLEEFRRYSYTDDGRIRKQDDHCLHPDTMVITRAGSRRIADLVGTVGEVLTVGGAWTPYRHCRRTALNQPVVRLTFEDGSEVTCTPDHKFLTMDRGWVEARGMQGADCLRESSPKRRRSLRERVTTCAVGISNAMAPGFTGWCGSAQPAGNCRPGTASTFTTLTATEATTSRRISRSCLQLSMSATTTKACIKSFPSLRFALPQFGTAVTKAMHGTSDTTNAWLSGSMHELPCLVTNAGNHMSHGQTIATTFARMPARLHGVVRQVWMTLTGLAMRVARRSASTSIASRDFVAAAAVSRCTAVTSAGTSDVYCMTVPETACFAVESGLIVHNCMDATRYAISGLKYATTQTIAPVARHSELTFGLYA